MRQLLTAADVLSWGYDLVFDMEVDGAPDWSADDLRAAKELARAMRQAAVFDAHRDKLADLTQPQRFAKTNRETLAKAIRAMLYDMDRAQEESDG